MLILQRFGKQSKNSWRKWAKNSAFLLHDYLAVQGAPTEFLDFEKDKNGNTAPIDSVDGNIFSNNVLFSSLASSNFGGTNSSQIRSAGYEIGPDPGYTGVLNINFLADGNRVRALAFGAVVPFTIRVYDQNNTLQATYQTDSSTFSFFGITQNTSGLLIGRVELDGNFFAIQDLQFAADNNSPAVPEPGSIALLAGMGTVGAAFLRRRKQARTTDSN